MLPEDEPGRRSIGLFVAALLAVVAAIVLMGKFSRRHAAPPSAAEPIAAVESPATAAAAPAAAAPAVAGAAPAAQPDEPEMSARKQSEITRVVTDGSAGLKVCYQRALVRDETLVHGNLNVRVSVAPTGRVKHVRVSGPAAFRAVNPCLERTVSKWIFPAAPEPYETRFPLVLQAAQ